jgi:hypothetical protein
VNRRTFLSLAAGAVAHPKGLLPPPDLFTPGQPAKNVNVFNAPYGASYRVKYMSGPPPKYFTRVCQGAAVLNLPGVVRTFPVNHLGRKHG